MANYKNILTFFIFIEVYFCSVLAEEKVYFGSLHLYTAISNGFGTPEEAFIHAKKISKLDFLAFTEQNHQSDPYILQKFPEMYSGAKVSLLISIANRFTKEIIKTNYFIGEKYAISEL